MARAAHPRQRWWRQQGANGSPLMVAGRRCGTSGSPPAAVAAWREWLCLDGGGDGGVAAPLCCISWCAPMSASRRHVTGVTLWVGALGAYPRPPQEAQLQARRAGKLTAKKQVLTQPRKNAATTSGHAAQPLSARGSRSEKGSWEATSQTGPRSPMLLDGDNDDMGTALEELTSDLTCRGHDRYSTVPYHSLCSIVQALEIAV